jgi:hypothetical protein
MDLAEMQDEITLLLIPFKAPATVAAETPLKVVFIDGVKVTKSREGNGNNKRGGIVFSFSAYPNAIADVIKIVHLTSW